ncbi:MAG: hypothetical protein VKM34_08370 [Cyanobacteriota bacterium]|nr:hypothetical protein [Cyanobacteriota bacterium]
MTMLQHGFGGDWSAGSSGFNGFSTMAPQNQEGGDAMETYFECITTCSLEDGECVTRCVEQLREQS